MAKKLIEEEEDRRYGTIRPVASSKIFQAKRDAAAKRLPTLTKELAARFLEGALPVAFRADGTPEISFEGPIIGGYGYQKPGTPESQLHEAARVAGIANPFGLAKPAKVLRDTLSGVRRIPQVGEELAKALKSSDFRKLPEVLKTDLGFLEKVKQAASSIQRTGKGAGRGAQHRLLGSDEVEKLVREGMVNPQLANKEAEALNRVLGVITSPFERPVGATNQLGVQLGNLVPPLPPVSFKRPPEEAPQEVVEEEPLQAIPQEIVALLTNPTPETPPVNLSEDILRQDVSLPEAFSVPTERPQRPAPTAPVKPEPLDAILSMLREMQQSRDAEQRAAAQRFREASAPPQQPNHTGWRKALETLLQAGMSGIEGYRGDFSRHDPITRERRELENRELRQIQALRELGLDMSNPEFMKYGLDLAARDFEANRGLSHDLQKILASGEISPRDIFSEFGVTNRQASAQAHELARDQALFEHQMRLAEQRANIVDQIQAIMQLLEDNKLGRRGRNINLE